MFVADYTEKDVKRLLNVYDVGNATMFRLSFQQRNDAAFFPYVLGLQRATAVLLYVVEAVSELAGRAGVGTGVSKTTSSDSSLKSVQWPFFVLLGKR